MSLSGVAMETWQLDDEFIDRIVVGLAVQAYKNGKPTPKQIEDWFRYAVAVQEARDRFRAACEAKADD